MICQSPIGIVIHHACAKKKKNQLNTSLVKVLGFRFHTIIERLTSEFVVSSQGGWSRRSTVRTVQNKTEK